MEREREREDAPYQVNLPAREENLDKYLIDWSGLNLPLYQNSSQRSPNFDHWQRGKEVKNGSIFCSRGCPYHCKYCSASVINGSRLRYFSPRFVINDIHKLYYEYGIRYFNIMDDNFTFDKNYVMEFCQEYLKDKLPDATFACPNGIRIDRIDEEMLTMMKKCGWVKLMIGIESGNPNILKSMRKNLDLDKVRRGVKLIEKYGIQSWGFFILGYPGETKRTIGETIRFALELPLTWASFSIFSPIPGTEIFDELATQGRIPPDYEMRGYHSSDISFSNLSLSDLRNAQRVAYLKFYARAKRLVSVLRETSFRSLLKTGLSILRD